MRDFILRSLADIENGYSLCGIVDRRARVYPLGSDTKVISALFEIVARQAVASYADRAGLTLVEPAKQNHYPDFTLMRHEQDRSKIALDVKTTYRRGGRSRFAYTLGSYTSFIRRGTEIVYPYGHYQQHWVIGFVYRRVETEPNASGKIYSVDSLGELPIPFEDVEVFMQERWRIAGDRAGSGNTTNIGSIRGTLDDFREGNGVFESETEFIEYWRGYKRTTEERRSSYSTVHEFRSRSGRWPA